jgi:hypothetical protein
MQVQHGTIWIKWAGRVRYLSEYQGRLCFAVPTGKRDHDFAFPPLTPGDFRGERRGPHHYDGSGAF